jgi:hypothetical protein
MGVDMGSEYIFFDEVLRDRFMAYLADHGIPSQFRSDQIEGFVVELADAVAEATESAIELEYDRLMELQRDLIDAADGEDGQDVMGVSVTLPDGQACMVRLPAAYGRRLVEHFTFEEIHELGSVIARNVANPVSGPLCRKT